MKTPEFILPAVAAIIFNSKGEVLLQKRRDAGSWCILSGHVEFGEQVEQAMLREIKEETGADASIIRFIGVYSSPATQTYHYRERSVQYITSYFEASLHADLPEQFSNDETLQLAFFPVDSLPADFAQISPDWLSDALHPEQKIFVR
jgi:8-oxo-dGTP diphosphatase